MRREPGTLVQERLADETTRAHPPGGTSMPEIDCEFFDEPYDALADLASELAGLGANAEDSDSWQRLDGGLPGAQAWWTVKRQAMCADDQDPVGLYFGTTSGELWASDDEGGSWSCIARHLPEIYAVESGRREAGGD